MNLLSELDLWYEALESQCGIIVETDNPQLAQSRLYKARHVADDPKLKDLAIVRSPTMPESELWLVKGYRQNAKA
jgi:hypothetical protein